jgi:hypothetical protein
LGSNSSIKRYNALPLSVSERGGPKGRGEVKAKREKNKNLDISKSISSKSDNNRKLLQQKYYFFRSAPVEINPPAKQAMHRFTKRKPSERFILPGGVQGT